MSTFQRTPEEQAAIDDMGFLFLQAELRLQKEGKQTNDKLESTAKNTDTNPPIINFEKKGTMSNPTDIFQLYMPYLSEYDIKATIKLSKGTQPSLYNIDNYTNNRQHSSLKCKITGSFITFHSNWVSIALSENRTVTFEITATYVRKDHTKPANPTEQPVSTSVTNTAPSTTINPIRTTDRTWNKIQNEFCQNGYYLAIDKKNSHGDQEVKLVKYLPAQKIIEVIKDNNGVSWIVIDGNNLDDYVWLNNTLSCTVPVYMIPPDTTKIMAKLMKEFANYEMAKISGTPYHNRFNGLTDLTHDGLCRWAKIGYFQPLDRLIKAIEGTPQKL